jgi:putative ABC transport system substrate-binding protein
MRRRELIFGLGGVCIAWPLAVHAQQGERMPVIGFLNLGSPEQSTERMRAFHQGLDERGFVEGRNVAIEYRWADYDYSRLTVLAAELAARRIDLIAATSRSAAVAAKAATTSTPIVFYSGGDPVDAGLVSSLNKPGGNLTGAYILAGTLIMKRMEMIHETVPKAAVAVLFVNPNNPAAESQVRDVVAAAGARGLQLHVIHAGSDAELDAAFITALSLKAQMIVFGVDLYYYSRSKRLAELAAQHRIPAVHQFREFAAAGGLMSFGTSFNDMYRLIGSYVGRILKGEKPADLPVQQPTRFELIVNLKAAKALGLDVPTSVLVRADEVIE